MLNYGNIFDNEGLTYSNYRELVDNLLVAGKTTGPDDSDAMLHYTKMNVARMNRVDKTTVLTDEILETVANISGKYHFLVITEGWCGDAAQIVPIINKLVSAAPDKFDLKLVLRDGNLPLIDAHLTNGGRAIPVLIVLNENADKVLATWAPRPQVLQALLKEWKSETTEMTILAEKLHGWYAKDKTLTTQAELIEVLKGLNK